MANKAISELPQAQNVNNQDLFVLEQSGIAKKLTAETFITEQGIIDALAEALDGHGGIQSVTLSSVSGRIRTYRITFTDQSATTFQVYDGTSIERISRTSSSGLQDTYTIFMSDGTTTFFTVTNGADGTVSEAMLNDALKDKAPAITETTESSAIANFTDGADDMVMHNVVVEINPVQSGSGDPSPSNVRPISGWTGANVYRTGKNLCDSTIGYINSSGLTYQRNQNDGSIAVSGTATGLSYIVLCGKSSIDDYNTPILKAGVTVICSTGTSRKINFRATDGTYSAAVNNVLFTPQKDIGLCYIQYTAGETPNETLYPMIRVAPDSNATYEPYITPTTVSLSWQTEAGTVYGGTIDVATGLLTVNRAITSFNGSETWYKDNYIYATGYAGITALQGACSHFPYATSNIYASNGMGISSWAFIVGSGLATNYTLDEWKSFLQTQANNGTPVTVAYGISTPQTYQLTPQEVKTLLGTNNVWADTGDTSVTYPADTKMFIEKLTMPTEDDLVANQAITSGKYFMVGNSLYLALANIASGAQITIGTNAQRVSLADALNTINS